MGREREQQNLATECIGVDRVFLEFILKLDVSFVAEDMRYFLTCGSFTLLSLLLTFPVLAISATQYREMGIRYRDRGQMTDAIAAFQKAVELDSQNLSGRVNLGWTLHLAKRDSEAMKTLEETFALNPFNVQTSNALGIVYLVGNDLPSAVLAHTWAALLKPNNEIAYYNLCLALEGLSAYDSAIAMAQRAAALEPDNPHPFVALAIAHHNKGEFKQAQESYQQAIQVDGRYRDRAFLNDLEEAGFSKKQIESAQKVLRKE